VGLGEPGNLTMVRDVLQLSRLAIRGVGAGGAGVHPRRKIYIPVQTRICDALEGDIYLKGEIPNTSRERGMGAGRTGS